MVSEPEVIPRPKPLRSQMRLWVVIFLIALVSRLIFLEAGKQLPVFWDARLYASAAIGLLGHLDRNDPFARGSSSQDDFRQYYNRYLAGEEIDWLYYQPPTLAEAQKYLFYSGPVYPTIMAAIFVLPWSNDFQAVRWFNAVIDSLSVVFLAMAAFLIWRSRRAAILTAIVQLLYWPLVITCGILALETISSFLLATLILALLLHHQTENRWWAAGGGLVAGLLFLTKPTAALLSLPVMGFWVIVYSRRWRHLGQSVLWYMVPFLLLAIPWTTFTSIHYGTFAIRDPEYATANFRSSSAINYEGYDLDFSDPDFWTYSVAGRIMGDPAGYGNLLLKKLVRLWWTPHDEFWQGPRWYETAYHRLLVIVGLISLSALPLMRRKFLIFPALMMLYYTGIHTIFHSVPRYNFNALPALFLMVPALFLLAPHLVGAIRSSRKLLMIAAGVMAALLLLNESTGSAYVLRYLPVLLPLALTIGLLAAITYVIVHRLINPAPSGWSRRMLWMPFFVLALTSITGWTRPQLREWATPVADAKTRLVTEITLPSGFLPGPQDEVLLAIDLTSAPNPAVPIEVNVGGTLYRFDDGSSQIDKNYRIKGSYTAFDKVMGLNLRQMRWYRMIKLAPEAVNAAIRRSGKLVVTVGIGDPQYSGPGFRLYGDPTEDQTPVVTVPSFSHTSIERFREWGDRRIYETYRLESSAHTSYVLRDGVKISDDLSTDAGLQQGRFRVYMTVTEADFSRHCF